MNNPFAEYYIKDKDYFFNLNGTKLENTFENFLT